MISIPLLTIILISSTISGMVGIGGGVLLLAFMSTIFPPAVLIPLHGSIQLLSNTSRSILLFRNIDKKIFLFFTIGAIFGALAGSQIVLDIPKETFKIILAIAILVLTWMPKIKKIPNIKGQFTFVGFMAEFLSLLIGATGPFVSPFFLKTNLDQKGVVVTKGACQIPIHLFKIIIFTIGGFALWNWIPTLILVFPITFFGNWLGKQFLNKVSEEKFRLILKITITILAFRLLKTIF